MNQLFMQEQDILTLTDTNLDVCACLQCLCLACCTAILFIPRICAEVTA